MQFRLLIVAVALALPVGAVLPAAEAVAQCCAGCGCNSGCGKVCRLICEEVEVEVVCWRSSDHPFCVPKASRRGCRHCVPVCQGCDEGCAGCTDGLADGTGCCTAGCTDGGCTDGCDGTCDAGNAGSGRRFVWFDWIPSCARLRTARHLERRVETHTICRYRWVVEDLCNSCESRAIEYAPEIAPDAEVPEPPAVDARIIHGKPVVQRSVGFQRN